MKINNSFYDTIDQIVSHGVARGILHLHNEDARFDGNIITLKSRQVVNFGSCSYLGLEFDERLKAGAKDAIDRYGTQFSESRAYVSLKPYVELEGLFQELFGQPSVVTQTTSLGHISNLPVIVHNEDAVILDHQVHNSVQTAASLLKSRGIHVELLRHNRMDILEDRLKVLRTRYQRIWYMADGIYSMYGDACPLDEVYTLMDLYPELHFYVDDAHGMSVYGKHGRGYVLHRKEMHPKMILATSLAKAFATGGAVMVYPDAEMARRVRTCGGPLITSGPLQPATLGAAIASARIHLSDEIYSMQDELHDRIRYATMLLKKFNLPVISQSNACVFFVGTSLPKLGYNLVRRMLDAGYYLNLGIFPAVPIKNTGVRFTITRLHTFSQIESMIATLAGEYEKALGEEGMTIEEVYHAFKMPMPVDLQIQRNVNAAIRQSVDLRICHYRSIQDIEKSTWDQIFSGKGTFDWEGLATLERAFTGHKLPEHNWEFDYLLVKDRHDRVVVATFFTTAIWKDDMLSPGEISEYIEGIRKTGDPYYLTSKVMSSGSLITEGEHLYIDKSSALWKEAMQMLFEKAYLLQENHKANSILLRDFHGHDEQFDNFMVDNGFYKIAMPDSHVVEDLSRWNTKDEFFHTLSKNARQHFRKDVRRHEEKFDVEVISGPVKQDVFDHWYKLYLNVKKHSLDLNTFTLPKKFFSQLLNNSNWEVLTLKLKPNYITSTTTAPKPVCVVFNCKASDAYVPMIIGIDYKYNKDFKVYRQALFQLLMRGKDLGAQKVFLGFSAGIEKRKLGAKAKVTHAYVQSKDSFNSEVLLAMNKNAKRVYSEEQA